MNPDKLTRRLELYKHPFAVIFLTWLDRVSDIGNKCSCCKKNATGRLFQSFFILEQQQNIAILKVRKVIDRIAIVKTMLLYPLCRGN